MPGPDQDAASSVSFIGIAPGEQSEILNRIGQAAGTADVPLPVCVLFRDNLGAGLEASRDRNGCALLEWPTEPGAQTRALDALVHHQDESGFFIWVTTRLAYNSPLVHDAGTEIARRFAFGPDEEEGLLTILGECLPNAIVHGNLGLSSPDYHNIDDFVAFQAKVENHLADPVLGERGVIIGARKTGADEPGAVCLNVRDEGSGFADDDRSSNAGPAANETASGRGLGIIRALSADVCFRDQGRRIDIYLEDGRAQEPVSSADGSVEVSDTPSLADDMPASSMPPEMATGAASEPVTESAAEMSDDIQLINMAMPRAKILVADDDDLMQAFLRIHLENAGYLNLIFAGDGAQAWEVLQRETPDFAILDVEMPGLSGFEVTERIRAHPVLHKVPVIIASAHTSAEFRNQALASGASDVLSKPVDPDLLADRVQLHLQNKLLLEGLESYRDRLRQELDAARRMLESLLPDEVTNLSMKAEYGVDLQTVYQPSSELGGDWWGIKAIDEERFALFVVDFTGHGVGPCINIFRLHTLMTTGVVRPGRVSPSGLLKWLNTQLHKLLPRGQFATMFYGVVNTKTETLTYAAAGSTPPFHGRTDGSLPDILPSAGIPLGLASEATYEEHHVSFKKGDYLLLYSDALVETPNTDGAPMSDDDVAEMLSDVLSGPVYGGEMVRLMTRFKDWAAEAPDDDLTMLLLCK